MAGSRWASAALVANHVPPLDQWKAGVASSSGKEFFYIAASVWASYKACRYDVQLWLTADGIEFCTCSCIGGAFGCHHAIALLARFDYAVRMPHSLNLAGHALRHLLSLDDITSGDRELVALFNKRCGVDASALLAPVSTEQPRFAKFSNGDAVRVHLPARDLKLARPPQELEKIFASAVEGKAAEDQPQTGWWPPPLGLNVFQALLSRRPPRQHLLRVLSLCCTSDKLPQSPRAWPQLPPLLYQVSFYVLLASSAYAQHQRRPLRHRRARLPCLCKSTPQVR